MKRPKNPDDPGKVTSVRRIGVELPDALTAEITEYVHAYRLKEREEIAVRDAVRERARKAAEGATVGRVAEIMAELLK